MKENDLGRITSQMQKSNIKHNRRTVYQLPYRIAASETAELFVVTHTKK